MAIGRRCTTICLHDSRGAAWRSHDVEKFRKIGSKAAEGRALVSINSFANGLPNSEANSYNEALRQRGNKALTSYPPSSRLTFDDLYKTKSCRKIE